MEGVASTQGEVHPHRASGSGGAGRGRLHSLILSDNKLQPAPFTIGAAP